MCTIFFLLRLALIFFCFIFLNEPHRIVRVSIDIAEKYKTTVLGDQRQEKKKRNEKKTHLVGLERQHEELRNSTLPRTPHHNSDRPVGLGHQYG